MPVTTGPTVDRLQFDRIEILPRQRQVLLDGQPLALGSRAFDVLLALAERHDRVVEKNELIEATWGDLIVEDNNLSVQISTLRKLLGHDAIATVVGRGYRFTGAARAAPAASRSPVRGGNVPKALTALLGRGDELERVRQLLSRARLVTLVGAGGIGKTTLAVHAAHALAGRFADGAWIVDLASIRDPALVAPSLAQCLGITLQSNAAADGQIAAALHGVDRLLVLDNCEHLVDRVAGLAETLLHGAAGLRLLATSQEPLAVPGEQLLRLAPLAVPPLGAAGGEAAFGAVQLFSERVRALLGDFEPSADELRDVADICRRVDGIALAIELAAARVPLLGVEGVREHLSACLLLPSAGHRAAGGRHQTMRATHQWSHALLAPETQVVLRRLSVFTGGFSLEAAQGVAADGASDGPTAAAPVDVLEQLALLADRSLLLVETARRPRWRMLETTRAFALDCLHEAGETELCLRRHAQAMAAIAERATQQRDSAWLWAEMSNMRAALAWAIATPGQAQTAVAIATYTAVVLATAGPVPEATDNLRRVQHLLGADTPAPLAAQFWQWLGRLGIDGRMPSSQCVQALQRAADMFAALGNVRHVHACRRQLAEALVRAGDVAGARLHLDAAAAMEDAATAPADRMRRLRVAGLLADACGQHAEALQQAQAALAIAQVHGMERYCQILVADRAWVLLRMGDADAAIDSLQALTQALASAPRQGLTHAYALAGLMAARTAAGQLDEAARDAPATIAALRVCNGFFARCDILAWWAASSGHARQAAQFLGAAQSFYRRSEIQRDRVARLACERATALVRQQLSSADSAFWQAQGTHADESTLAALLTTTLAGTAVPA